MKSVNAVRLLGNVGQAPEITEQIGKMPRATLSLATNEKFKKGDKWEDHTEWHRVVFFGRLAEIVRDYVRKGSKLHIEGKLRTVRWEDDAGHTRYQTNIIASDLILLDSHSKEHSAPEEAYEGVAF